MSKSLAKHAGEGYKTRAGSRTKARPVAASLALAFLLWGGAEGLARRAPSAADSPHASARAQGERAVAYKGVGFYYDPALASEVKAELAPPSGCGKPGDVEPAHPAFTFVGYPKPHESPFMHPPEIRVFPVAEYRRALEVCEKELAAVTIPPADYFVSSFDEEVRVLKALNAARPAPRALGGWLRARRGGGCSRRRMPLVPMYDVCEALHAKVSYVDFRNGRGVAFVTQYTIESTLITNQALAYVFQGLTDDGEFYVSAAFPVAAPFLPPDFSEDVAARHGLDYRRGMFTPAFRRNYEAYKARTARRLESLAPDAYSPSLAPLAALLRSLNVNRDLLKSSMGLK
jgi:hypothetical protein